MVERPDLDAVWNVFAALSYDWNPTAFAKVQVIFDYCRELEAENKRLKADLQVSADLPKAPL